MSDNHGTAPTAAVNQHDLPPWMASRYGDLLEHFPPEVVDRHRGLLRFAVGPDVHRGVEVGRYALPRKAPGCDAFVFFEVRAFAEEPRLAGYRLLFRRGPLRQYHLVPWHQVADAFDRLAEQPELAAKRYLHHLDCGCCHRPVGAEAAGRGSGFCVECTSAWQARRRARAAAKKQAERQRDQEVADARRRVIGMLERRPRGHVWRTELLAALGDGTLPAGKRLDLALPDLVKAGRVVEGKGSGPSRRIERWYRARAGEPAGRPDLRLIPGGKATSHDRRA